MINNDVEDNENTQEMRISSAYGKLRREMTLSVGKTYIIKPLNVRKTKNRDRQCTILDFVPVSEYHPNDIVAKVRYLDNNRIGRAELEDLANLD